MNRGFGVELESHPLVSSERIAEVIKDNSSKKVFVTGWRQSFKNCYWHVKTDSTCGGGEKHGWEIVSYKGSGERDVLHIAKVAGALGDAGLACGADCGLHVHVDMSDFVAAQVGVMLARWIKAEKLMMESVPRFRSYSGHCRSIRHKISPKNISYCPVTLWESMKPTSFFLHGNKQKKVTMNLVNYATCVAYESNLVKKDSYCDSSRKTVEFRFPEGTFCSDDVANWVRLFVAFVESCKDSMMPQNLLSARDSHEFFEILGLCGSSSVVSGLKCWLAERIVKNSTSKKWRRAFQKVLENTK